MLIIIYIWCPNFYLPLICILSRFQYPCGLRRSSAAARLLRSWVRIPPRDMDICLLRVMCVVMYRSLRREDHSSRGVLPTVVRLVCNLETSRMRRPWPALGRSAPPPKKSVYNEYLNVLQFLPKYFSFLLIIQQVLRAWNSKYAQERLYEYL